MPYRKNILLTKQDRMIIYYKYISNNNLGSTEINRCSLFFYLYIFFQYLIYKRVYRPIFLICYHIILYRKNNSGDILLPPLYQIYLLFYSSATISTKALICCFVIFSYLIFYKNTLSNTISYFYFIWCLTEI